MSATVLVVGGGGREHALAWGLERSPHVGRVVVAPGNGGTPENAGAGDLMALAIQLEANLAVIGPEVPLAEGLADALRAAGVPCFGPSAAAARIEASKAWAKGFMRRHDIPTARSATYTDVDSALAGLADFEAPVVKASGLAAGKGVLLPDGPAATEAAVRSIFAGRFGAAGAEVILEERLTGPEISVLAFCDGERFALMPAAQDHKRAFDGDEGPNTGGMGAFAPSPLADDAVIWAAEQVIEATLHGLADEGAPFVGCLYAGLMLTPDGPQVLEFNCRFGDPETQVLVPLLESDLFDVLLSCALGCLDPRLVRWRAGAAATVVAASGGYPGAYEQGLPITGVDAANAVATVFHAGTRQTDSGLVTAGGRVLAVTGLGADLGAALGAAYAGLDQIHFPGLHARRDIGGKGTPVGMSYRDAGVDIDAGAEAVRRMAAAVQSTHGPAVLGGFGSFGGLFALDGLKGLAEPVLVASADGVGTKTRVAVRMGRFDTIGMDLVNHCVNDVLVQGARPLFFLDYFAASRLDPAQVAAVVTGCAEACNAVGCALLGGETAEMPGVYHDGEFDLVGNLVGVVDKAKIIDGSRIAAGDVVLGLASSGLHTNGYSLARRIVDPLDWSMSVPGSGVALGEALLAPHRCYLHEVERLWAAGVDIRGLCHITGGGLVDNPPRIVPDGLAMHLQAWPVPPLFRFLQSRGEVADLEMRRTFNMGLGLLVVVPASDARAALEALGEGWAVGCITPRTDAPVTFA